MALSELVAHLMRLARSGQPVATALADRRLDDALEAAAAGNHDRACVICEEMVERFPRHAAGHRLLGMLRARSGEPGAALPHLQCASILAPTRGKAARRLRAHLRSITLEQPLPVFRVEGVRFVDLQYTDTSTERARLAQDLGVQLAHWQDALADYDDTAALVAGLDLTLTVCTAVAHLAGALGKPAWVMTPYSLEWHDGHAGEGMIWYQSLRLIRQTRYREWEPVIGTIAGDLAVRARG